MDCSQEKMFIKHCNIATLFSFVMLLFSFKHFEISFIFIGFGSTLYNFSYDVAFGHAVFAYLYQDGFMIASLSDGRHVLPELAVKGDGKERMKDGGYYTDVVCGKKYFYLLSQGDVETSGLSGTSSIEVYDYEGNPMKKINLDIIASHMVYDKINKRVIFSPSMDNDLHVLDYEFE